MSVVTNKAVDQVKALTCAGDCCVVAQEWMPVVSAFDVVRSGPGAPDDPDQGNGDGADTGLITKTRTKTKKPSLYKVLLLNDDYTPQEFVIFVLERFFNKGVEEATQIMLHVHHKGVGICGVYTFEIAETKVAQVMDFARQHQHPLQCTMEKE